MPELDNYKKSKINELISLSFQTNYPSIPVPGGYISTENNPQFNSILSCLDIISNYKVRLSDQNGNIIGSYDLGDATTAETKVKKIHKFIMEFEQYKNDKIAEIYACEDEVSVNAVVNSLVFPVFSFN